MALTAEDVASLARLARIELSEAELEVLAPQLDVILESVARVSEVAAQDIPPTSHALLTNVFREDVLRTSLPREQVPGRRRRSKCDSGCREFSGRRHESAAGRGCRDHPTDRC